MVGKVEVNKNIQEILFYYDRFARDMLKGVKMSSMSSMEIV